MKFSSFTVLPIALLAASVAGQAPSGVTIQQSSYSGNGCPQGSVSTNISPDRSTITFGFDSFQAFIGPGQQSNKQKNCQLHLGLRYPSGFQFSLVYATFHGYVRLDPGVKASLISSYYFSQNAGNTAQTRFDLSGPQYVDGQSYTKEDTIPNSSVVWSPCGANGILNVNNRIALSASDPNAQGEISTDDATIRFEQILRISWRRC